MRARIGTFSSRTLAGVLLEVPTGLQGPTLLCFAYEQRQQPDVESWLGEVAPDDRVAVLEIPVLGRRWLAGRRLINGGMAAQMDATTRAQTMCVYTDVANFRRDLLGVDSEEVCAVLVDADGTVLWSATGPATSAGRDALREAIDLLGRGSETEDPDHGASRPA